MPRARSEPVWPTALAVLVAIALYLSLPDKLVMGPPFVRYAIPVLELALVGALVVTTPHRRPQEAGWRRRLAIGLMAVISVANALALAFLVDRLLTGTSATGRTLLVSAAKVWTTNVLVFALWFWELDGGGPPARMREPEARRDFAFVQMTNPELAPRAWHPQFVDYLYLSFTNSSAFSPTDTLPLTARAKLLMLVEAAASVLTFLLVAARAVNVLK